MDTGSCRVGDVFEDGALEDDPVCETLRDEPGEVDCCVDADGGEGGDGADVGRWGGFRPELREQYE